MLLIQWRIARESTEIQTKKDVYNHIVTKYNRLSPFSNPKSEKEGIACPQLLQEGVEKKVKGVQTKKDVYNHVLTIYKRLTPFSNPKSEEGVACPQPPWEG